MPKETKTSVGQGTGKALGGINESIHQKQDLNVDVNQTRARSSIESVNNVRG